MIQKLSHTTIYVLDQEQALDFYTNKLGFEMRMDMTIESGFRWLTVGPKSQPDLSLSCSQSSQACSMKLPLAIYGRSSNRAHWVSACLTPTIAARRMPSFRPKG